MKNKFNDDEGGDGGKSGDVDDCEDNDDWTGSPPHLKSFNGKWVRETD